ncbi:Fur family transcriptional regulator [Kineococcus aurantiacus]|uniref:Fur family ferric uptake transcriptional regulator n=1 Tax=Kineococcus aurantiacus TaxID=37633 RepID=A0A7Y9DLW3_9ACTN|nr:transcriptional repressor [Kineococcus aurantiacus]NYD23035.1 Fur family ferric uptake transcriptional regulator [Kineococcus aurantiacus]
MSQPDPTATEELLRRAGLRSTAPRRSVLQALDDHPHATAAGLAELLERTGRRMSRQSLYNVLEDLTRTGVLRSIQPAGSAPRYETRVDDNHHHAVCRTCGTVVDVPCAVGTAACLTPAPTPGFPVVDHADITWWGLCTTCAAATATATATATQEEPRRKS